jgi:hypothetical protein
MSMELGESVRWAFWLVVLAVSIHPALFAGAVASTRRASR